VILSIVLASAIMLLLAAGLVWTARLVHVGNLDAQALAEKVASPVPASALDWPELRVYAAVPQPGDESVVLLHVGWPARPHAEWPARPHAEWSVGPHAEWSARPRCEAVLLLALDYGDSRSLALLAQWCASVASISPASRGGAELELRRRQSLDRVHAILIAEDSGHMQIA
jgi:hypothetical protein